MSFSVVWCPVVKLQEKADLGKLSTSKSLPPTIHEKRSRLTTLNVHL